MNIFCLLAKGINPRVAKQVLANLGNRKPGLREQWRRINTRQNWKEAFKTLGWKSIKEQFRNARKQSSLFSMSAQLTDIAPTYRNAQKDEAAILKRMVFTNRHKVMDKALLSSSWCYKGVWQSFVKQDNYWSLFLTTKIEDKDGNFKRLGKTYTYHNFPPSVWCLMKQALGREGTGAGSVFWDSYLRGFLMGREVAASPFSNQVTNIA